jgi:hypothetical protein
VAVAVTVVPTTPEAGKIPRVEGAHSAQAEGAAASTAIAKASADERIAALDRMLETSG